MKKFVSFLILSFVSFIFIFPTVFAADAAYIYKNNKLISQEILDVFHDMSISVDLIQDKNVKSTNFNNYDLIFINDEYLRNAAKNLDISKHAVILMTDSRGNQFGLTDRDGISRLAANSPLNVIVNHDTVQVYQIGKMIGKKQGRALSYYYLSNENEIPGFDSIADAYNGNGDILGDVVAVLPVGEMLSNGKTTRKNICFYGIAETDFWTPEARELFEQCVNSLIHVSPPPEEPVCGNNVIESGEQCDDGNLINGDGCSSQCTIEQSEMCGNNVTNEGELCDNNIQNCTTSQGYHGMQICNSQCNGFDSCITNEFCSDGIVNGLEQCDDHNLINGDGCSNSCRIEIIQNNTNMTGNNTELKHDVMLSDLKFKHENNSLVTGNFIMNQSYRILIDVKNSGNFTENVTYKGQINQDGNNVKNFSHLASNNLNSGTLQNDKTRTVLFDINPGIYTIIVMAMINQDDMPDNNVVMQNITVVSNE